MQKSHKTLLLVDDSTLVINRLTRALRETLKNTAILSVLNGIDALDTICKNRPSVVLLDIQLPDISGIEILKRIKNTFPEIKVVMLTNQSSPKIREVCLKGGADGFYDKTKEFESVINHIKKINE